MKRFVSAMCMLALLLTVLTVGASALSNNVDDSSWEGLELKALYYQTGGQILSDVNEDYFEFWWDDEVPELDNFFQAASVNMRGFAMSPDGRYLYMGTLNGGTGVRGVVVYDTASCRVTDLYYRYDGDESYLVENVLTGDKIDGFYATSLLETKDKYSSFIGGNNAHVRVYDTAATGTKPTLILVKDSFAHSVVPFLALHFNLEIIDLRSYVGSVASLARETEACGVLILHGADNLAISDTLTLLGYGLNKKAE